MKIITEEMLGSLIDQAGALPRLRANYNVHESPEDPVQRLFIAAEPSSYFRPHRHEGKSELALIIRGLFDILLFDLDGTVTERIQAGRGRNIIAVEIPADIYHTWIPMEQGSVFFEVKKGPYDPAAPASFAIWSPPEGSAGVKEFQTRLLNAQAGDCVAPVF
ncbi:MAG TPA: WbuC family cupin fold metalloprotein [Smithellaceae bacterium]|nr:WbuC family cupin fold metalloprotein [Smithellaceae bacterium]HQF83329.1 WbuC family cupin fold metalloprotein [Smithellaceae bacterium]HQG81303.1 WbuC family cupin fold metalloprotein [Smithellaceae bacterium]